LIQFGSIPLEEDSAGLVNSRTGHHQHVTVGQQGTWTIGNVEIIRKIRTGNPGITARGIDGRVTGGTGVGPSGENRAVGPQDRRPQLVRGLARSTAVGS